MIKFSNIISYDMYDIYMIYQPFEQLESLYLESKLITTKNFKGTYFDHIVTISDLGAGPQSRPLPFVEKIIESFYFRSKFQKIVLFKGK